MTSVFLNNKQKGFTLVETIVALGLVSVGVFMAMNFIDTKSKNRSTRTAQTIFRYISIQVAHTATMASSLYPPITSSSNDKAVYVSCFSNKGEAVNNINNLSGYQVYFPTSFNDQISSNQCAEGASYEARFYWNDVNSGELRINVINLAMSKLKKPNATHNFKIFVK